MNIEVLKKTVGQVAGIGGLALGVFLLLFREIIRKQIFPQLAKTHAYRLLRLISIFVFLIAVISIGAWVWAEKQPAPRPLRPGGRKRGVANTGNLRARDIKIERWWPTGDAREFNARPPALAGALLAFLWLPLWPGSDS